MGRPKQTRAATPAGPGRPLIRKEPADANSCFSPKDRCWKACLAEKERQWEEAGA